MLMSVVRVENFSEKLYFHMDTHRDMDIVNESLPGMLILPDTHTTTRQRRGGAKSHSLDSLTGSILHLQLKQQRFRK